MRGTMGLRCGVGEQLIAGLRTLAKLVGLALAFVHKYLEVATGLLIIYH